MTENLFFFLILIILGITGLIYTRHLYATVIVLLIIYTPFSVSSLNPRAVFGIMGLNPFNLIWIVALLLTTFRLILRRQQFDLFRFFSPPILIFLFFMILACLQTALNINNIPRYGDFHLTMTTLLLAALIKPIQYLISGWLVFQFCQSVGNQKTVERSIFVASIVFAIILAYFFSLGQVSSEYIEGRIMVNNSMGMHSNGVGAMGVYFLFSILFFKEHNWPRLRLLAAAASLCIIIISFSRISYLSTLVLFLFSFRHLTIKERTWSLTLASVLIFVFSSMIIARIHTGFDATKAGGGVDMDKVSAGRTDTIWKPLLPEIAKDPLLGKGTYGVLQSEVAQKGIMLNKDPHSGYLQILLDMGITGFMAVLFMMASFLRKSRKVMNHFYFLVIAMFLLCLTGHSFYPKITNFLFWIGYGMTIFQIQKSESEW